MSVTLVCRHCKRAQTLHSRLWYDVICTACGNKMVVLEHERPPEGYRDHRGRVIRYPRYSPTAPQEAQSPIVAQKPTPRLDHEGLSLAERKRLSQASEAARERGSLPPVGRPGERPAWLAGLPDPPRLPNETFPGRDMRGRYLPKPWFPSEIRPPGRRWMLGTQRTRTHARKCRHCGTMFTGFLGQKWCSRLCRSRAFYQRNKAYWVERRKRKAWSR